MPSWPGLAVILLLGSVASAVQAADVAVCQVEYGGEARRIEARSTTRPYEVPTVQVGSYFLFRLVFEEGTAVKVYVYADKDKVGAVPLHQATFSLPLANRAAHGFSGLHHVYEPVRDGELKYSCALK